MVWLGSNGGNENRSGSAYILKTETKEFAKKNCTWIVRIENSNVTLCFTV